MDFSIMHNINGKDMELNIVNKVSLKSAEAIIDYIVSNVIYENEYRPYRFDFCYWVGVLNAYTDFDTSSYTEAELFEIVDDPILVDKIRGVLPTEQLDRIELAARKKIEAMLNRHPLKDICDDLSKGVNKLVNEICIVLDDGNVREELKQLMTKENIALFVKILGSKA